MAKDKNKKHHKHDNDNRERDNRRDENRRDNNNGVPKDVTKFAEASFKAFKKKEKYALDGCDSKKEKKKMLKRLKLRYIDNLLEYLPAAVKFAVTRAGIKEYADIIEAIKEKVYDEEFVEYLIELVDNKADIDNLDMLPIMYRQFLMKAYSWNKENGDDEGAVETKDIEKLIKLIIKKKYKKLIDRGVPEKQAFDYVTILPTIEVLKERGQYRYYVNSLLTCMYGYAKEEEVKFDEVMRVLFKIKDDDCDLTSLCVQILLEKKDVISEFTEGQKDLYNKITSWCLDRMESKNSKAEIERILRSYIHIRQNDERNHRDANRRVYLSTISAEDYPKIASVVANLGNNVENKKYL